MILYDVDIYNPGKNDLIWKATDSLSKKEPPHYLIRWDFSVIIFQRKVQLTPFLPLNLQVKFITF